MKSDRWHCGIVDKPSWDESYVTCIQKAIIAY